MVLVKAEVLKFVLPIGDAVFEEVRALIGELALVGEEGTFVEGGWIIRKGGQSVEASCNHLLESGVGSIDD